MKYPPSRFQHAHLSPDQTGKFPNMHGKWLFGLKVYTGCNTTVDQKLMNMNGSCAAGKRPEQIKIDEKMAAIKHKIAVMSGKGGVGKSTVAANLSRALSASGKKVAVLDVDITGPNLPKMLGAEGKHMEAEEDGMLPVKTDDGLSLVSMGFLLQSEETPVIWRGPLKMGAIQQLLGEVKWGVQDYLVIDLPPGTGDEPLSIAQLLPNMDGVVIVTTPQDVALMDARKSVTFARRLKLPILGIVENMSGLVCPHCGKDVQLFGAGGGKRCALEMDVPFLGAIPVDGAVVTAGDGGYDPFAKKDNSPAASSFLKIVKKMVKRIEKGGK